MAGGLLNIIAIGNNNVILTGNPSKTFFKVTYSKYSNFGLQKFRIDYDGLRNLRLTEPSTFSFKIPRYAELLMDTYLVVTLPDIWSPIYPPSTNTSYHWVPYEFRWIRELGTNMIQEVTITCGSLTLQKYTGQYLAAMVDRDFTAEKKELFNKMSGNVVELNDPANAFGRKYNYPSASYTRNVNGAEPSIRSKTIYIPINTWFTLNSNCAFPLIALQYNELVINVTLRPIQELYQIRDIFDTNYSYPYIQPDYTRPELLFYRHLQTPPTALIQTNDYLNKSTSWNADIHLLSTYCFLSKEEANVFAKEDQVYLVKDVFNYNFENITGTSRVKINSTGMIANWMWFFQRNDANLRNEWSNYTNWPYDGLPSNLTLAPTDPTSLDISGVLVLGSIDKYYRFGVGVHDEGGFNDGTAPLGSVSINTGISITGDFHPENQKEILNTMGILLNGEYRENTLTNGIFNYVEKYTRTQGFAKEGLYCYNFCLNTSPFEYQPSGAINLSKFKDIQLEISTIVPTIDLVNSQYNVICDLCGNPIGVVKSNWRLYDYNFNMTMFEERYNVLSFIGGNCGMLYSR